MLAWNTDRPSSLGISSGCQPALLCPLERHRLGEVGLVGVLVAARRDLEVALGAVDRDEVVGRGIRLHRELHLAADELGLDECVDRDIRRGELHELLVEADDQGVAKERHRADARRDEPDDEQRPR